VGCPPRPRPEVVTLASFDAAKNTAKLENVPGLATALAALLRRPARACAALACVWATLLIATLASASAGVQTETRVWAFESAPALNNWLERSASPRLHRENQLAQAEPALGSPHAARAAPVAKAVAWAKRAGSWVKGLFSGKEAALEATVHGAQRVAGAAATRGGVLSAAETTAAEASGRVMT
jgi:hypothetical protein